MKVVEAAWKKISVTVMVALLFCLSAMLTLAADEVAITELGAQFPLGTSAEDGQVRIYTYTILNADKSVAGKVEFRYGAETRNQGKQLWITEGERAVPIKSFSLNKRGLLVPAETWTSFFPEESYSYECTEEILATTNPVKSIRWGTKGGLCIDWNDDEEADAKIYDLRIYQDGTLLSNSQIRRPGTEKMTQEVFFTDNINSSGSYTVSLKAIGNKTIGDSEDIVTEIPYEYKLPETKIGEIKTLRWKAKEGETVPTIIEWEAVGGAYAYDLHLVVYQDGKRRAGYGTNVRSRKSGDTGVPYHYDWSEVIQEWTAENVTYVVLVRPLSPDIEEIANGGETELKVYEVDNTVKEVQESLKAVTADTIINDVTAAGIESVAIAMQKDEELLDKIRQVEEEYKAANGSIQVEKPAVVHPAIKQTEDIEIVGAAMNAVSGGSIRVNFKEVPEDEKEEIDKKLYQNAVQVDITLTGDKEDEVEANGRLRSPITITMYPPEGVELSKLVILHYHSDGTSERIYPVFRPDGKITFSVTSFSNFVFAEMVIYTEGAGDTDTEGNKPEEKPEEGKPKPERPEPEEDEGDSEEEDEMDSSIKPGIKNQGTARIFRKANGQTAKSEWIMSNGKWYFADAEGILKTGWHQNADRVWYFLNADCEMATGWQMVDSKWYYLDTVNGAMKTGWLQTADGKWYFLNADGAMKTGWLYTVDGKWYYLGADGACLMNTTTPDGYQVDAEGAWIR